MMAITVLFFVLYCNFRIIRLTSQSIPHSWCLQLLNARPKKGELCVFERNGVKTVKYLVGLRGSRIKNLKDVVCVEDYMVGKARRTKSLTPVASGFVPNGYAFVAGTHEYSFDSRYEEFGLVDLKDMRGKAIGILKW
jgi:type IV secretory pathway protease TraF